MKKHYSWLWFDADNTLFDYNKAESNALKRTFYSLNLPFEEKYLGIYQRINHDLWQALERHEISPADLRARRFALLLESLQLNGSPDQMSNLYIEQLALGSELMDGAYEVLQSLQEKCRFAIVTNGLQAVQRSRLSRSMIRDFITDIIISEEIGSAKPHSAFFETASSRLGHPPKSEILIIGDSLTSDMQGGVDYGIDTCWFNPNDAPRLDGLPITYEIRHLREVLDILA